MEIIKSGSTTDTIICDPNGGGCDDGICAHKPCDPYLRPPVCFCLLPWV